MLSPVNEAVRGKPEVPTSDLHVFIKGNLQLLITGGRSLIAIIFDLWWLSNGIRNFWSAVIHQIRLNGPFWFLSINCSWLFLSAPVVLSFMPFCFWIYFPFFAIKAAVSRILLIPFLLLTHEVIHFFASFFSLFGYRISDFRKSYIFRVTLCVTRPCERIALNGARPNHAVHYRSTSNFSQREFAIENACLLLIVRRRPSSPKRVSPY